MILAFKIFTTVFVLVTNIFLLGNETNFSRGLAKYMMLTISLCLCSAIGYLGNEENQTYKKGQIDAITGKIKYELKTQPDSTREWVELKK